MTMQVTRRTQDGRPMDIVDGKNRYKVFYTNGEPAVYSMKQLVRVSADEEAYILGSIEVWQSSTYGDDDPGAFSTYFSEAR